VSARHLELHAAGVEPFEADLGVRAGAHEGARAELSSRVAAVGDVDLVTLGERGVHLGRHPILGSGRQNETSPSMNASRGGVGPPRSWLLAGAAAKATAAAAMTAISVVRADVMTRLLFGAWDVILPP
jgi:hypothetical protein